MRLQTMNALLLGLTLAVGCGGSAANARTTPDGDPGPRRAAFDETDVDRDAMVNATEFYGAIEGFYDDFDANQDGRLDHAETANGLYEAWDLNRDGAVDESELGRAVVAWFPESMDVRFDRWDENNDGELDRAELHHGLERTRVFAHYDGDADGSVTDLELSDALFTYWDVDGDDALDALEWRFD
ncbi:MAG: hypothetical protein VYE22_15085 [Myxococcota bacterium]|nr:hypothetical protein [Myxococcota bacterium]